MNITLKNFKYSDFASQETHCYEATLYADGKKFATAQNDGHGGCDNYHATDVALYNKVMAHMKTLVDTSKSWDSDHLRLECIVSDLITETLRKKDAARIYNKSKKRVIWIQGGDVMETNIPKNPASLPRWAEEVRAENPDAIVLNGMERDAAIAAIVKSMVDSEPKELNPEVD